MQPVEPDAGSSKTKCHRGLTDSTCWAPGRMMNYPSSGGGRSLCPRSLLRLKLELRFRISLARSRRRRTLQAGGTTRAEARRWNVKP